MHARLTHTLYLRIRFTFLDDLEIGKSVPTKEPVRSNDSKTGISITKDYVTDTLGCGLDLIDFLKCVGVVDDHVFAIDREKEVSSWVKTH
jgi:hypothetical protein